MIKITILGSGGWGLALACTCARLGHSVTVWSKFSDEIEAIKRTGELKAKLPGVQIPKAVGLTTDISCVSGADVVLVGIPSAFVRSVCEQAKPFVSPESILLSTAKGLEGESLKRMSEVISETFPSHRIAVMSGPSHAEELGRGMPTAVAVASDSAGTAEFIQKNFSDGTLRLYVNGDVVGCEIGGAVKNVIALCCGITDGLGYGDNTKAALITRGLSEMTRLGVSLGGMSSTFSGLAGLGDLVVTCTSIHSRNYRAGVLIGKGTAPDEAVRQVGTVEGYACAKATLALSKRVGVEMPITEKINAVLFDGEDPHGAIVGLMTRPHGAE